MEGANLVILPNNLRVLVVSGGSAGMLATHILVRTNKANL